MSRYIDADELYVDWYDSFVADDGTVYDNFPLISKEQIDDAPSIDVVPKDFHDKTCEAMAKRHTKEIQSLMPKRGTWIDFKNGWKCNACGKWNSEKSNFCPNCGADMREGEGE